MLKNMYVTDTHALLWYLTEDKKLGKKAKEIFTRADKGEVIVIIPTLVLAESLFVTEKYGVELEFIDVLRKIQSSLNYVISPLDIRVVMECQYLKKILELHDRIIVATAKLLDATLLTQDKEIMTSAEVKVVW